VVQAEAVQGDQAGEGLAGQVVDGVVAQAEPLDVLQALRKSRQEVRKPSPAGHREIVCGILKRYSGPCG